MLNEEMLAPFLNYFENTWLNNVYYIYIYNVIKIDIWNYFSRLNPGVAITNNVVEGWHNYLLFQFQGGNIQLYGILSKP